MHPAELCRMARAMVCQAVSLTDHETVCETPAMRAAARAERLGFLLGMEVYAHAFGSREGAFHIVALDFDPEEPKMCACLQRCAHPARDLTHRRLDWRLENACGRASAGRKKPSALRMWNGFAMSRSSSFCRKSWG